MNAPYFLLENNTFPKDKIHFNKNNTVSLVRTGENVTLTKLTNDLCPDSEFGYNIKKGNYVICFSFTIDTFIPDETSVGIRLHNSNKIYNEFTKKIVVGQQNKFYLNISVSQPDILTFFVNIPKKFTFSVTWFNVASQYPNHSFFYHKAPSTNISVSNDIILIDKITNDPHPFSWIGYCINPGRYIIKFDIMTNKNISENDTIGFKRHLPQKLYKLGNIKSDTWTHIEIDVTIHNHDFLVFILDHMQCAINVQVKNVVFTQHPDQYIFLSNALILFAGGARTFISNFEQLNKNLIEQFNNPDVYYYLKNFDPGPKGQIGWNFSYEPVDKDNLIKTIESSSNIGYTIVEKDEYTDEEIITQVCDRSNFVGFFNIKSNADIETIPYKHLARSMQLHYNLEKCGDIAKKINKNYDYYIFCRPDTEFLEPIVISVVDKITVSHDYFAVIPKKYFNEFFYGPMQVYRQQNNMVFTNSEAVLWHGALHNIHVNNPRKEVSCWIKRK